MLPTAYDRGMISCWDAARNNAEWCDTFCRSYGIAGRFADSAWSSPTRTPPLYPDAVTLSRGLLGEALLGAIDNGPGASVKDSFADLDLAPLGFEVLFCAEWLCQTDDGVAVSRWSSVSDVAALARWERAWGGAGDFFRAALLEEGDVAVLVRYDEDAVAAGAIANRSRAAIGLTNLFDTAGDHESAFVEAASAARVRFGPLPVVCHEHGQALEAAKGAAFVTIGELVVWVKPPSLALLLLGSCLVLEACSYRRRDQRTRT
jgi:hypothetical protein